MSASAIHEIKFIANPVQKQFIESQAKADLFSARMGEGKSAGLAWSCFYHTLHNPGTVDAVIRDTWTNLESTTMREIFKWFPPGVVGEYRATNKSFTWGERTGLKGELQFLGLDDPHDASKLQSRELGGFFMDEPAPAAESGGIDELIFDIALSRLRQPGINWYAAKLAQNSPDETHWSYRRFVDPGTPGFVCWRTEGRAENVENLPEGYYESLESAWAHRPDLKARFLHGRFGFQQLGKSVTPEWSDEIHLASKLKPMPGIDLHLAWDFGLNPTCIITQITPAGFWNVLEAHVGEDMGAFELIAEVIKPRLASAYPEWFNARRRATARTVQLRHVGDPAGEMREQSSSANSAVRVIRRELGGTWRPGPQRIDDRVNPLRAVLRRVGTTSPPRGVVQVDRDLAKPVWHALRGGWHYNIHRTGIIGDISKNIHSHPGDALAYLAAVLFPMGRLLTAKRRTPIQPARYGFSDGVQIPDRSGPLGFEQPGRRMPRDARRLG